MKRSYLLLSTLVVFITSCVHEPFTNPTIIVSNDTNYFQIGDTIQIDITMSDIDGLHEAFIYVKDTATTFFSYSPIVHDLPSFTVDTFWVVNGISSPKFPFLTTIASDHYQGTTTINIQLVLTP